MADLKNYSNLTATLSRAVSLTGKITVGNVYVAGSNVDGYTKKEVDDLLLGKANTTHNHSYHELVDVPEIPSIEGLATEEYVKQQIGSIEIPEVDLSDYALKSELPSTDGLASTNYVDEAINSALGGIESELDDIIGEEV